MRANSGDGFRKRAVSIFTRPRGDVRQRSATGALILATFIHEITLYGQTVHAGPLCFCQVQRIALRAVL